MSIILKDKTQNDNYYVLKNESQVKSGTYFECLKYIKENEYVSIPSYYIIKDLSTWNLGADKQTPLEKYESVEEAIERFKEIRSESNITNEDEAGLTLGVSIHNITRPKLFPFEMDIVHVRGNINYLNGDFLRYAEVCSNPLFVTDLNKINDKIGLDKLRRYRHPTEEEIVNQITECLETSGLTKSDIKEVIEKRKSTSFMSDVCENIDLRTTEIVFFSGDKSLLIDRYELNGFETTFLSCMAEAFYDKSNVGMDKDEYVEAVLQDARENGYIETVAKLKDMEVSAINKDLSRKEIK